MIEFVDRGNISYLLEDGKVMGAWIKFGTKTEYLKPYKAVYDRRTRQYDGWDNVSGDYDLKQIHRLDREEKLIWR